ncbi:hypothetical protein [Fulvimarina sp. MAC3]|uniref:hypothetical protein n=1 Tax=Fulvimarina sp. MAC3 TaxID=3148887 RepID=UPI0031FD0672
MPERFVVHRPTVREVLNVWERDFAASAGLPVWRNFEIREFCAVKLRELSPREAFGDCLERYGEAETPTLKALQNFDDRLRDIEEQLLIDRLGITLDKSFDRRIGRS